MAFKMKGGPMHRNYGVGTPTKKVTGDEMTEAEKQAAIDNAMGTAVVSRESSEMDQARRMTKREREIFLGKTGTGMSGQPNSKLRAAIVKVQKQVDQ